MRAIVGAMTAIAAALAMGAWMTRAHATGTLVGTTNGTTALKQLLQETKTGTGARVGPHLTLLQKAYGSQPLWHDGGLRAKLPPLRIQDGYVRVSVYGDDISSLRTQLIGRGMLDAKRHDHAVTGRVPIAALSDIASISGLRFVKPVLATTRAGLTTTQGDHSMRSNVARAQFGVDGTGVRVGVLSDSFDCAPGPFATGQYFSGSCMNFSRCSSDWKQMI